MAKHLIHKQRFEIEVADNYEVHPLFNRLSTFNQQKLVKVIEHILDRFDLPGQVFRFDRLEIDVGYIDEARLEQELLEKIPKALVDALLLELNRVDHLLPSLKTFLRKRLTSLSRTNPSSPSFYAPYSLPDFTKDDFFTLEEIAEMKGMAPGLLKDSPWKDKPLKEVPFEQIPKALVQELQLIRQKNGRSTNANRSNQPGQAFEINLVSQLKSGFDTVMELTTVEAIEAMSLRFFLETGSLPNWWVYEGDPMEILEKRLKELNKKEQQALIAEFADDPKVVRRIFQQFPKQVLLKWMEAVDVKTKAVIYNASSSLQASSQAKVLEIIAPDQPKLVQIQKEVKGLAINTGSQAAKEEPKETVKQAEEREAQGSFERESSPSGQKRTTNKPTQTTDEIDVEVIKENILLQRLLNLTAYIAQHQTAPWWFKSTQERPLEEIVAEWVEKLRQKKPFQNQLAKAVLAQVQALRTEGAQTEYLKNWLNLWPQQFQPLFINWVTREIASFDEFIKIEKEELAMTNTSQSAKNEIAKTLVAFFKTYGVVEVENREVKSGESPAQIDEIPPTIAQNTPEKEDKDLAKDETESRVGKDTSLEETTGQKPIALIDPSGKVWTNLELIQYFLRHGALPAGIDISQTLLEEVMRDLLKKEMAATRNSVRVLSTQALPASSGFNLISDQLFKDMLQSFMPPKATELKLWHRLFKPKASLPQQERRLLTYIRPHLLSYAAAVNPAQVSATHYIRHLIRHLNQVRQLSPQISVSLLKVIVAGVPDQFPSKPEIQVALQLIAENLAKTPTPAPAESAEKAPQEITRYAYKPRPKLGEGEPIFIKNAGLILLWPFLSMYFDRLKMMGPDRKFKDTATASRAVHLLQYLTTKQAAHPEFELVLNKLLCGLPLEDPVDFDIELTEEEISLSESLLNGVVGHWKMLGKTTTDGLRGSFLIRNGKLLKQEGNKWLLKVEEKPFDMLIDKIPWGLGMVKLSWMPHIITVEWR